MLEPVRLERVEKRQCATLDELRRAAPFDVVAPAWPAPLVASTYQLSPIGYSIVARDPGGEGIVLLSAAVLDAFPPGTVRRPQAHEIEMVTSDPRTFRATVEVGGLVVTLMSRFVARELVAQVLESLVDGW